MGQTPPDGNYARLSTLPRFRLSIRVPGWTRYRDVAQRHTVRNGGALPFLRMISIMSSSPPLQIRSLWLALQRSLFSLFFILIVLLMVLLVMLAHARDYIRLEWQSKLYGYDVTDHSYKHSSIVTFCNLYMAANTCQSTLTHIPGALYC